MVLQRLGNLIETGSIGECLDHADGLHRGGHQTAVMVEVVDHGSEVNLEGGLVDLQGETLGDAVEPEAARAFHEDERVAQGVELGRLQQFLGSGIEGLLDVEARG